MLCQFFLKKKIVSFMKKTEPTALILYFYLENFLSLRYSYRVSFSLDHNLKGMSHEMDLAFDAMCS
jgi:hypothetical protein